MVKIAIAGPGQVAREVIDALVATGKHEIIILSRKEPAPEQAGAGVTWVKVDYQDFKGLVQILHGVHTVLSFIVVQQDPENASQKALIDAAIEAGVKRFAPSEWMFQSGVTDGKAEVRRYLEGKNKDKRVIEYCLFRPSIFLNYVAGRRKTAKHLVAIDWFVDIDNCRAIVPGSALHRSSLVTVQDVAKIVAKAVDHEGEWPIVGGINGNTVSLADQIAIGENITGKPFKVEVLDLEDLKKGVFGASWVPVFDNPALSHLDQATKVEVCKQISCQILLSIANGDTVATDEWNKIFVGYKFTGLEEFVTKVWADKWEA